MYLLIQGLRGNPGLGRYRARKEIEAGTQTVIDTYHHHLHQALQISLQLANPILKEEGGQMKPYRRQDLEAETKGCPGEGLSFSGLWVAAPCASVHPSPKPHTPPHLPLKFPTGSCSAPLDAQIVAPSCDSSGWNVGVLTLLELKPFNSPS